jgi:hypothetical protein
MRLPRFHGLRRRLSYANVMATLALFFALSGGAMAATKYLQATDPITQGDLAGSTYGSPVIAAGKVTTAKIADGAITSAKFDSLAVAPNSAQLGGLAPSAYMTKVGSGRVSISGSLTPGSCALGEVDAPAGTDPTTDYIVVSPLSVGYASVSSYFTILGLNTLGVGVTVCNVGLVGQFPLDVSGTYRFEVLR